jgi:hypothetical protein
MQVVALTGDGSGMVAPQGVRHQHLTIDLGGFTTKAQ